MTLVQFLTFLYHNVLDFSTYTSNEEFLTALTAAVFKDASVSNVSSIGENVVSRRDGLEFLRNLVNNE